MEASTFENLAIAASTIGAMAGFIALMLLAERGAASWRQLRHR